MKYILVAALFTLLLIACQPTPAPLQSSKPSSRLAGLWRLHIMELRDTTTGSWLPYRDGMQGYLLYDGDGHMALHLSTRNYEQFSPPFPNFTPELQLATLQHLTNSYHYLGTYTIDEAQRTVTHTKLAHSNPKEWGLQATRRFQFRGDTLVITPTEEENANLRLQWLKQ